MICCINYNSMLELDILITVASKTIHDLKGKLPSSQDMITWLSNETVIAK